MRYEATKHKSIKLANGYITWKRLTISRDLKRFLLHLPAGVLAAVLCDYSWGLGIPFFAGFLTYQVVEDWRICDSSYKDILGFLTGFGATAASLMALQITRGVMLGAAWALVV